MENRFIQDIHSVDRLRKIKDVASDNLREVEREVADLKGWIKDLQARIDELSKK
jgi:predicted  nucleic acid-binding Zn-ribbon protein